jgi:hypothetical protein
LKSGRRQRQNYGEDSRRPARKRGSGEFPRAVRGAARLAVIWFTAFALIFQTTVAFASQGVRAPDPLARSEICNAPGGHAPAESDSTDRAADHFKCIACVIAHSLAPPAPLAAPEPLLIVIGHAETWPFSAPAPQVAPRSSHSARGPPATA